MNKENIIKLFQITLKSNLKNIHKLSKVTSKLKTSKKAYTEILKY